MPDKSFFTSRTLSWFSEAKRDLPWRKTHDPYAIWISEIMLQQTQVDRVIGFYTRFMERFPTVFDLAKVSWEDFLPYFRGLGYYRRGQNILKAANVLVQQYDGKFPSDVDELQKLPGIGRYTANAIASFAFGLDVPVKDTNVSRVVQRFFNLTDDDVWNKMAELVPPKNSSNFNQGVMELGALICSAALPKCNFCPLSAQCHFAQTDSVPKFTVRERPVLRLPSNARRVSVALIYRDGKILIARRKKGTRFAGFYEFPGGKLEPKENERSSLKREILEELGVEISVRPAFSRTRFVFEGRHFYISFHRCQILLGDPEPLEGQEISWIYPRDIGQYEFPPANKEVIEKIPKMRW
ncbi:MAG: A/G-specific adenine glycosylase [Patescibacteria group bacterium]